MEIDPAEQLEQVVREDGRYPLDAFRFLQGGLEFSAQRIHGERGQEPDRHVTGQQLCEGLRDLALRLWGPLAGEILRRWNVTRTRDFGEMVFLMVRKRIMGKRETDVIEDFDDVYDFASAFTICQVDLDREPDENETETEADA